MLGKFVYRRWGSDIKSIRTEPVCFTLKQPQWKLHSKLPHAFHLTLEGILINEMPPGDKCQTFILEVHFAHTFLTILKLSGTFFSQQDKYATHLSLSSMDF